jgi:polyhydroxyalkanoate synthase
MFDPLAPWFSAFDPVPGLGEAERIRRGLLVHREAPRPPVGLTPHRVIHRQGPMVVRAYGETPRADRGLPVVLIPSLINRAYILDLEPGRSMVEALAASQHATCLVDWGVFGPEHGDVDIATLFVWLRRAIDRVCRYFSAPKVHLFGYCQGGTLAAMFAALHPDRVATLSTLAAPVRFREGGRFRDFAAAVDVDRVAVDGLVPVEAMKPAFQMLDPMGNVSKYLAIEAASTDPKRLRQVMARERWLEDNVPLPAAFAREFIQYGYKEDRLLAGTWQVAGTPVALARIIAPTLVVVCDNDFVCPAPAATPLAEVVRGARLVRLPVGHIGVVVGSQGPKQFYPLMSGFFREMEAA